MRHGDILQMSRWGCCAHLYNETMVVLWETYGSIHTTERAGELVMALETESSMFGKVLDGDESWEVMMT